MSSSLVERAGRARARARLGRPGGRHRRRRSSTTTAQALVTDVEKLTRVVKTINSERDSIDTALQVGPLALGNLAVAFNNQTGTIGSRIGVNGTFGDARRAALLDRAAVRACPRASKDLACKLFEQLLSRSRAQTGKQPRRDGRSRPAADRR